MKNTACTRKISCFRKTLLLLSAILLLTLLFSAAACADSTETMTLSILGDFDAEAGRSMLASINDLRANDAWYWNSTNTEKVELTDLRPLVYDYELERIAQQRAAELAVYYAHTRANGQSCFTAYTDAFTWGAKGENIAYGYISADSVFTAWAEADKPYSGQGHRRNMLNSSFNSVGVGCFFCGGQLFWVQEFSSVRSGAAPASLTSPVSVETLTANITLSIDRDLRILEGGKIPLDGIGFSVKDSYSPYMTLPCDTSGVTCRVSDTSVARITDGALVGVKTGETELTAVMGSLRASAPVVVDTDTSIRLSLDTPVNVTINPGDTVYFRFTPTESGEYTFFSEGSSDTYGYVYDNTKSILAQNDDSGENGNFSITYSLQAGTSYYFGARLYYSSQSGSTSVRLVKQDSGSAGGFSYTILADGTASIVDCTLSGDVVIPGTIDGYTVTNLRKNLFQGKRGVTSVTIPASVTYFGTDKNNNNWDYVFSYCYDLQNIDVDGGNTVFKSVDGVLYSKDGNTLINYPCSRAGEVYHVTAGTICCTAFASCRNLRFLFLDNADTGWYTYTFYNTGTLTTFYVPGGYAAYKAEGEISQNRKFIDVSQIHTLPAGLKTIETEAFRNSGIQYLIIPDFCTRIASGAFADSALLYVSVGSATRIASDAFDSGVVIERR